MDEQMLNELEEEFIDDSDFVEEESVLTPVQHVIQTEEPVVFQEETIITQEPIVKEETIMKPNTLYVKVNFPKSATPVDCVSANTNCSDKIVASNKQLALLQNRFYFIPVDCDETINSDEYSVIKVFSEFADCIDVRYIKNGVACILPLKHNFKIKQGMQLAIMF